jgi:putative hydrolase of the HAD superfamily
MIKAVLFDYGGVLSPGGKSFRAAVAEVLGIPAAAVHSTYSGPQLWNGEVDAETFFAAMGSNDTKTVTAQDFLVASRIMDTNPKVYDLAKCLRDHGIKTAILSNMYEASAKALQSSGHYDGFDPVILSYREGMSKPSPEFYQLAIQQLGLSPGEILFIDDQERFTKPAKALGMQTICADSEDEIVSATKAILLAENGLQL